MNDKPDLRNDLAKARDEWFAGDGAGMTDPFILKEAKFETYLKNRLATAFVAGWDARDKQP